jgi:hypothetical protein
MKPHRSSCADSRFSYSCSEKAQHTTVPIMLNLGPRRSALGLSRRSTSSSRACRPLVSTASAHLPRAVTEHCANTPASGEWRRLGAGAVQVHAPSSATTRHAVACQAAGATAMDEVAAEPTRRYLKVQAGHSVWHGCSCASTIGLHAAGLAIIHYAARPPLSLPVSLCLSFFQLLPAATT